MQDRLVLSTGDHTKAPCMEQVTTTLGEMAQCSLFPFQRRVATATIGEPAGPEFQDKLRSE